METSFIKIENRFLIGTTTTENLVPCEYPERLKLIVEIIKSSFYLRLTYTCAHIGDQIRMSFLSYSVFHLSSIFSPYI